ncbi:MAG: acyl-CoA dehydrogenase [Alphaproteobacteria bacterium]|jgi:3-(methylthio)propanoyl-CoA dehydrogenase|nr:acyl-CoA dehydrogenase [Alphaproteobacteria bacterium]
MDYKTPVEDMLFALKYGAEADRLPDWDDDLARDIITQSGRFVDRSIAPLDPLADISPPVLIDNRVRVAPELVAAVREFTKSGWLGLAIPEAFGGQGLPGVLTSAVLEMLGGACVNFLMLVACPEAAMRLILDQANEDQKRRFIPGIISGEYSTTIVLSEPQAGSDISLIATKAHQDDDGVWHLTGNKVFTSNADHDLTPNILHCVLARTGDADSGARGLSLFLCPAVSTDGQRNTIRIDRIEDKMGLHACPTCQVFFDGAVAEIVGAPGEGLMRMFTMMNAMRIDVAAQGTGLCQVAAQRSRGYAAGRRQGRALQPDQREAGAVPINRHGDVRRGLLTQTAWVEGLRSMLYRCAVDIELGHKPALVELMTPVCKVLATDAAVECANIAIQIHGGYGYIKEYRVEQILRDARIGRIFEGANGLHATNLVTRTLTAKDGASARAFEQDCEEAILAAQPQGATGMAGALSEGLVAWRASKEAVARQSDPGFVAYPFMEMTGLLALGMAWSRLQKNADKSPNPERISTTATFVRDWMLPETKSLSERITSAEENLTISEKAFQA